MEGGHEEARLPVPQQERKQPQQNLRWFLLLVSEDWEPTEDMDPARFLLVPGLATSMNGAALFITCMRGPEHGSVDGAFSDLLGA